MSHKLRFLHWNVFNRFVQFQENYNFLLQVEEEIIKELKAGAMICDVYEHGVKFVKNQRPELVDHLTKNFGFAMGIEFKESSLLIGPKTRAIVKKNMTFNVNVGFSNLSNPETTDKTAKIYALFIGDTVMVNEVMIT